MSLRRPLGRRSAFYPQRLARSRARASAGGGCMLGRDQIKQVAQEIDRTADERMRYCDDRFDQQQLWEVVRRACRVIETVSELDDGELAPDVRSRRARFVLEELESALE